MNRQVGHSLCDIVLLCDGYCEVVDKLLTACLPILSYFLLMTNLSRERVDVWWYKWVGGDTDSPRGGGGNMDSPAWLGVVLAPHLYGGQKFGGDTL